MRLYSIKSLDALGTDSQDSHFGSYLNVMCVCVCALWWKDTSQVRRHFQTHGVHVVQSSVLAHIWSWLDCVVMTVN